MRWLAKEKNASPLIMFHHRFPTSTINCRRAAHPLTTKDYFGDNEYVLVHNGVITNADELFVEHQALGIEYQTLLRDLTYNDSEALLWDFALYMEGKQDSLKAKGAVALICMKLTKGEKTELYFARNSNPLFLDRTDQHFILSSQGNGITVQPYRLFKYDYATKELTDDYLAFPTSFTGYTPYRGGDYWEDADRRYDQYTLPGMGKLSKKQRRKLRKQQRERYNATEYSQNPSTGLYEPVRALPIGAVANKDVDPYAEPEASSGPTALTTADDIDSLVMAYLISANFNFQAADEDMQADYYELEALSDDDFETSINLARLQRAIWKLEDDDEFKDENSVSSKGEELWKQVQTA